MRFFQKFALAAVFAAMFSSVSCVSTDKNVKEFHAMKNVRDFGAKGDGITKDTAAIQKAINAGGMVVLPPGIYLSGTLYLKSNGGLYLEPGAVLKASPDKEDYNADDFCSQNRVFTSEKVSGAHFITAVEQENIVICGGGRIDGNRQAFYGDKTEPGCEYLEGKFSGRERPDFWRPAQMVFLCECRNVRITDVQMYNAPYWTCFLHGCDDVQVRGIRILNDQRTFNGDGLDIDCCRRVTVSDCIIDSGDDCITLRGSVSPLKQPRPCEWVTITNCILHTNCNAFRIGVGDGIIRHALISNCTIHDSRTGINICSKYSEKKGVLIENVQFENIYLGTRRPISVLTNAWGRRLGPAIQKVRNISFHHIRGTMRNNCLIAGYSRGDLENITLSDVELKVLDHGPYPSGFNDPGFDAPAAFRCEYADGVIFDRCRIFWDTKESFWKNGLEVQDCPDILIRESNFGKPSVIK